MVVLHSVTNIGNNNPKTSTLFFIIWPSLEDVVDSTVSQCQTLFGYRILDANSSHTWCIQENFHSRVVYLHRLANWPLLWGPPELWVFCSAADSREKAFSGCFFLDIEEVVKLFMEELWAEAWGGGFISSTSFTLTVEVGRRMLWLLLHHHLHHLSGVCSMNAAATSVTLENDPLCLFFLFNENFEGLSRFLPGVKVHPVTTARGR